MERVELLVEAGLNHAAFAHGKGRLLHDRGIDEGKHVFQRVDIPEDFAQHCAFAALQPRPQRSKLFNRRRKAPELPRVSGAVGDAGHEPLKIIDAGQVFDLVAPEHCIAEQLVHRVQAAADLCAAEKRLLHPGADEPFAHGGLRAVEHPEERALFFAAAHRARQFQITPRRKVKAHKARAAVKIELPDIVELRLLRILEVGERSAESTHCIRRAG